MVLVSYKRECKHTELWLRAFMHVATSTQGVTLKGLCLHAGTDYRHLYNALKGISAISEEKLHKLEESASYHGLTEAISNHVQTLTIDA